MSVLGTFAGLAERLDDQGDDDGAGRPVKRVQSVKDRQDARGERHRLKKAQRAFTTARSSRLCWTASTGGGVLVEVGSMLTAHVSKVHRCGSPWACPSCSPVVRFGRAEEINVGVSRHLDGGGHAEFLTLTLRHHRGDKLADRLPVVTQALGLVLKGAGWERRKRRLGYLGSIRVAEITWGEANGWHPHCHAAMLFERRLTKSERDDLEGWIYGRWLKITTDRGLGTVNRENGVDMRPVYGASELGQYLTKVEGGWSLGAELAQAHRKGRSPIELLRSFVETGDSRWLTLWLEYEDATFGKQAIVWSRGLKALLLDQVDEVSDVELAHAEGEDVTLVRATVDRGEWHAHLAAGSTGGLLSIIEEASWGVMLMVWLQGLTIEPLEPLPVPVSRDAGTSAEPPDG